MDDAVLQLKAHHGTNWSLTTALQLLSGRRGQFAAECGLPEERTQLYFVHLLSKLVCDQAGLGSAGLPTPEELNALRALAENRPASVAV